MKLVQKTYNPYSLKYTLNNQNIKFGSYGIKAVSFGKLTEIQLNSIERFIMSFLKKNSPNNKSIKVWNFVHFNLTLTKLSSESRMGKGKGSIYSKAIFIKPGTMLFEFSGILQQEAFNLFKFIKKKFPFKINLIKKVN